MHRQTPIAQRLYNHLFPRPTPQDPPSFAVHLARNLVPEVRIEVATFYGDLNSTEARYPGLNYCHPPHRMRLGRFKHHKRLFEAFDSLGLTYHEIQEFCCWEGTKWARERFEKDEGIKVLDTTGDDIKPYVDRRELQQTEELPRSSITRKTSISVVVEEAIHPRRPRETAAEGIDVDQDEETERHEMEDETMSDVNEAEEEAMAAEMAASEAATTPTATTTARRQQRPTEHEHHRDPERLTIQRIVATYEQNQHLMPPELEQLLKEQSERGGDFDLAYIMRLHQRHMTSSSSSSSSSSSAAIAANRRYTNGRGADAPADAPSRMTSRAPRAAA